MKFHALLFCIVSILFYQGETLIQTFRVIFLPGSSSSFLKKNMLAKYEENKIQKQGKENQIESYITSM